MFDHLFRQGAIGKMQLKNRIFLAPMVRNYAQADGHASARYVAHIERIARGGVGAMTLEASYVALEGRGFTHQLGVHEDGCIEGLRRLAEAAHRHDARIGIQLYHAGRQTVSAVCGGQPVAPSPIPCPLERETPRALTTPQIAHIVGQFADASGRAVTAGLDYVEIHAAHGYLITQFLSAYSNTREDGYGGSLENRMRLLFEILAAVRARVGADFPVIVRLSGEEMTPGGLTIEDTVVICRRLEALGADAVHISCGNYGSYVEGRMIPPMSVPDAPLADLAERVRSEVAMPVITVGKIRSPELAEELLAQGVADFVALGRPLLADPDWPNKAKAGELAAINKCIACNEGCISRLFAGADAWCLVNPEAGRELEFAAPPATAAKRVMVVGGGPGGMAAALSARRAGHDVTLYEKTHRLGGTLFAAAAAPHRSGWTELRRHMTWAIADHEVPVRLGVEVTAELVRAEAPDVVILAAGALPRAAPWASSPGMRVMSANDVLCGARLGPARVVVAGGGCSGAQTAEYLAEQGACVTLVEAGAEIAADTPMDERALLLKRLRRAVLIRTRSVITGAGDGRVRINGPDGPAAISADCLVVCFGAAPDDRLQAQIKDIVPTVISIGDCVAPRQVLEAIAEGAQAGLRLDRAPSAARAA